jgi:general L-amino acid transport system substrate-binding protein
MRLMLAGLAVVAGLAIAGPARAGSVLDRVRAAGVVHCGATERPGLAEETGGLLADLCRAVAVAVLGPQGRAAFGIYDSDRSFDAVRRGTDDVFFLGGGDVVDQHLGGAVLPGPVVYAETISVMVKDGSAARHVADLAGHSICFPLGDAAQRNLAAWFDAHHLAFTPNGYQETDEMTDAFDAGACDALAEETTALAAFRGRGDARILPEPLTVFPLLAMTGTSDAAWSAAVAWVMDTVIAADTPVQHWAAGGVDALPLDAMPALGLTAGWQARMIAAVGSYDQIRRRNLGETLRLPAGPNQDWRDGGALLAPHAQ